MWQVSNGLSISQIAHLASGLRETTLGRLFFAPDLDILVKTCRLLSIHYNNLRRKEENFSKKESFLLAGIDSALLDITAFTSEISE